MKLEVGMYVRTKDKIVKIEKISDGVMWDTQGYVHFGDFIKASHNIIDLIEVEDYVNGGQVREKTNDYIRISGGELMWQYLKKEEDIKLIVTKEMFSSVEYRVETN